MLKLPDLTLSRCLVFSACGQVETKDKAVIRLLKQKSFVSAKVKSQFVAVIRGEKPVRHFHVEVIQKDYFGNDPPKPTHTVSDVRSVFQKLDGCTINVDLVGVFRLSTAHTPAIISKCLLTTRSGDVSLKITGGRISVTGAPVHRIYWSFSDDHPDELNVTLNARATKSISDSYLVDAYKTLESAFATFAGTARAAASS